MSDSLGNFKAIGWHSAFGSGLAKGIYWAKCPDCGEECVYTEDGKPTTYHRGNEVSND